MHLSVYLPVLFSGLFGVVAPVLARRLPPAVGTWLLSVGGMLAAAGSAASLALLGFTLVGQSPLLAARGHWSDTALRHADPVAAPVAVVALIVLAVLTVRFAAAGVRRLTALRDAYRAPTTPPNAARCSHTNAHPCPPATTYLTPSRTWPPQPTSCYAACPPR